MDEAMVLQWGPEIMMDPWFATMLGTIWMVANVFWLVFFLLQAWGLFMINKKLWENHPWVAFIPVINLYSYFTASKKPWVQYLLFPILWLIVWGILAVFTFGISLVIAYIYMLVMMIKLLNAISKRCGRWAWTTVWFIFIPFIMYPVVWYKLNANDVNKENTDAQSTPSAPEVNNAPEQKVEL